MNTHHIVKQLKQLKLSGMAEGLDQYLLQAEQNSLDYAGFLSMLLGEELELLYKLWCLNKTVRNKENLFVNNRHSFIL